MKNDTGVTVRQASPCQRKDFRGRYDLRRECAFRHVFFYAAGGGEERFMRIIKQLNNNIVVAADEQGHEIVLMGKGIGFGARPGMEADLTNTESGRTHWG